MFVNVVKGCHELLRQLRSQFSKSMVSIGYCGNSYLVYSILELC